MALEQVLNRLDADGDAALERLFALLRIPSISTDPAFAPQVRAAAEHVAADLGGLGFEVTIYPTAGHPMVVAHWRKALAPGPHVLFYGHYDVQPVDPLELWHSNPFEPQLVTREDGARQIVARGAADDKGQVMTFIEACRAWIAETGTLPVPVSFLLEGEEESGSPSLIPFLKAHGEAVKADLALVCDTNMWNRDTPAVTASLRGLLGEEVTIHAASKDLHSGLFGGAARNPLHVLSAILADLHDAEGRVTLPGFYEGVPEPSEAVKALWDGLDFSESAFLGEIGLKIPAGEQDRSVLEQIWSRPTLEINGIIGGYTGKGFKTVIPAKASAKLSCRLVGDQDPEAIRAALRAFIEARLPADCTASFEEHGASGGIVLPLDGVEMTRVRAALADEWGCEAVPIGMGGSIPIVGAFKTHLDMDSIMVGFGLDDDQIHSPNEKYDLRSFQKGARSWARILHGLRAG